MKFTDFTLDESLLKGIEKAGFTECLPVQEESMKETLAGKDVSVRSQTGSGKTAAFMIPILQYYCITPASERVKTIIIAPTRELAVQIESDARLLGSGMKSLSIGCFYGGVGYKQQESALVKGVDIIIGTPGRLIDFGKSGKINFKQIGKVVIDEADRLFDMGFYPDIKKMMRMLPPRTSRQTMLFSATLSNRVRNIAWEFMNMPVEVEIEPENVTVEEISQVLYHVSTREKMPLLLGLMEKLQPNNAIIFTNTKHAAVEISERLKRNGYHVMYIMGDLPQKKRLSVIKKVKSGEVRFLVATDVAARGLHVDDLELVINYDLPEDFENYVHRIGRTARAGKSGKAISFACEKYVYGLEAIEKYIGFKIPVEWADDTLYKKDKTAGVRVTAGRERKPQGRASSRGPGYGRRTSGKTSGPRTAGASRKPAPSARPLRPVNSAKTAKPAQQQTSRPAVNRKTAKQVKPVKSAEKLSSGMNAEERLAYYRAKYGENFSFSDSSGTVSETVPAASSETSGRKDPGRKGFFTRLFRKKE